jgi:hypothetical protein
VPLARLGTLKAPEEWALLKTLGCRTEEWAIRPVALAKTPYRYFIFTTGTVDS